MHALLLDEERHRTGQEAQLVIVSVGDREHVQAEGFSSLVLLDRSFAAGAAFRAGGTPTAVALDANGNITSPVRTGSGAVLSLLAASGRQSYIVKLPSPRRCDGFIALSHR